MKRTHSSKQKSRNIGHSQQKGTESHANYDDQTKHRTSKFALHTHMHAGAQSGESAYRAEEQEFWKRQIRVGKCLNYITLLSSIVALLGLFALFRSIAVADMATIESNRAWVSPVTAYIGWPNLGKPIAYQIVYENTGHAPALGLNWRFDNGYFPTPADNDGRKVNIRENSTYADLEPKKGGTVEFPRSSIAIEGAIPHNFSGSSDKTLHPVVADQDMLDDKHRFYVQGCVAYSTMGRVGRSKFCFYYIPTRKNGVLNFDVDACPAGWSAD